MHGSEMRDYRKLDVWQQGRRFAVYCYRLTSDFPKEETFGMTSQIRRAAICIPSNIAEGVGRNSDPELLRSTRIALGSLNELETQVIIASDLGYIGPEAIALFEAESRDLGVRLRNLAAKLEGAIETANPRREKFIRELTASYGLNDLPDGGNYQGLFDPSQAKPAPSNAKPSQSKNKELRSN
jgi:four helix bundle protein